MDTWSIRTTKPIQSQLKPIQSQLKPIKCQNKANSNPNKPNFKGKKLLPKGHHRLYTKYYRISTRRRRVPIIHVDRRIYVNIFLLDFFISSRYLSFSKFCTKNRRLVVHSTWHSIIVRDSSCDSWFFGGLCVLDGKKLNAENELENIAGNCRIACQGQDDQQISRLSLYRKGLHGSRTRSATEGSQCRYRE